MAVEIEIAAPQAHEKNFIRDSWRRSFQEAPACATMPMGAFVSWAHDFICAFIGDSNQVFQMAPGCHVLVARDGARPVFMYGWILFSVHGDQMSLVYAFTKGAWRRQRIAGKLIAAAMEQHDIDPERMHYGSRTRYDETWKRKGWTYRPFQELLPR